MQRQRDLKCIVCRCVSWERLEACAGDEARLRAEIATLVSETRLPLGAALYGLIASLRTEFAASPKMPTFTFAT